MVLLLPSGWDFGKGMLEVSLLLRVRTLLRMKCCFFFYSLRKWGPGVVLALVLDAGRSFREAAIKQRLFGNPSRTKTQSLQSQSGGLRMFYLEFCTWRYLIEV